MQRGRERAGARPSGAPTRRSAATAPPGLPALPLASSQQQGDHGVGPGAAYRNTAGTHGGSVPGFLRDDGPAQPPRGASAPGPSSHAAAGSHWHIAAVKVTGFKSFGAGGSGAGAVADRAPPAVTAPLPSPFLVRCRMAPEPLSSLHPFNARYQHAVPSGLGAGGRGWP
jgi:hypothetical protein